MIYRFGISFWGNLADYTKKTVDMPIIFFDLLHFFAGDNNLATEYKLQSI